MKFLYSLLVALTLPGCAKETCSANEIIKFDNNGVVLEGELNIPGGATKYPLAIFIHGSGMATRNDYQEFVTPFALEGIATFRYDKRGVGESGGEYNDVGPHNSERVFGQLASDAAAAIRHFANDKRILQDKIIIIGGSQAGWIIPEINSIEEVWLSVCISGPSVTVGEEIFYSDLAEKGSLPQTEADLALAGFKGPHGFDPIERIEKIRIPSLWIFGGKDVSIPVKRSMHLLDSVRKTNHLPLEIKLYPHGDHGLYNNATATREPYINAIVEWIRQQH
jgi:uncharacterized protein